MAPLSRHWPRYLGALAVIIVLSSVSSSYAALAFISTIFGTDPGKSAVGQIDKRVPGLLANVKSGEPQTLLLIGSDKRDKRSVDGGRTGELSDTIMLARLDGKGATALLSIPRDTAVQIPQKDGTVITTKINAAFAEGGEVLTLKVVKSLLGIQPSHVVVINFAAFQRAVNRLGCLYQDIDRSYFNDNSQGENYATIDVQSGYQLLCGADTLDWVRFRHTDSDLVRAARQQAFLRSAKNQIATSKLIKNASSLVGIFKTYTRTDIHRPGTILGLLKLALDSSAQPMRSIKFRAVENTENSNLGVTPQGLAIMRQEFNNLESSPGATTKTPKEGGRTAKKATVKHRGLATGLVKVASETTSPQLTKASFDLASAPLPVYYPSVRLAVGGYALRDPVRTYEIRRSRYSKRGYPAFRLTYSAGEGKYFGQYYGVQGTTWKDAPILREQYTNVRRNGRTLRVYTAGGRYQIVAWITPKGAYWVSNSLSLSLGNQQMLDIAASLTRVAG